MGKPLKKRIKNWIIYVVVKFGFLIINGIERRTAFHFFTALGWLGFYVVRSEQEKTIRHLQRIFGNSYSPRQIKTMAKEVFINLARNMVDAFRIATFTSNNIDRFVSVCGIEKLDTVFAEGKGVLAITGHIGNWELLGAYLAFKGYPLNVIGAPIYDPRIDEMVVKNRTASGAHYIARGSATRDILRALKRKEIIGILMDQDSKRNEGAFIDFLGHDAYTPVGPAVLAVKTGAPVVPMVIHIRKDNSHVIEIRDRIELINTGNKQHDIPENTLRCSKALEHFILEHPTQWVWMHERWKTKREDIP